MSATQDGVTTVGIVGGGQLARMMAESASALGIEVVVLARPADESVAHLAELVDGSPLVVADMAALAGRVDVVTFDHEPADLAAVEAIEAAGAVVRPSSAALRWADKAIARRSMVDAGLPVPPFVVTRSADEVCGFAAEVGWPVVAKLARGGFDGRGVHVLTSPQGVAALCDGVGVDLVVEPQLDIEMELAVLVVTGADGSQVTYDPVRSVQERGMCREVVLGDLDARLSARARAVGERVADAVGAVGVLAVELFVVGGEVLVNEVAPRPHNSGHLTIDACVTSQFENHLRAVAGLPLGSPVPMQNAAAMVNVVGADDQHDPRSALAAGLSIPDARVHFYAKSPRAERKVGHVTVVGVDPEAVLARARAAVAGLEGPGSSRRS